MPYPAATEPMHFCINLSVGVIQMIFQNRKAVVLTETVSCLEAGMNALPLGVARRGDGLTHTTVGNSVRNSPSADPGIPDRARIYPGPVRQKP